jgi:hypothetical protein
LSTPRSHRILLALLSATAVLIVVLVVAQATGGLQLHALRRMTGSEADGGQFAQLVRYLNELQKSILPLAIPLGILGITGGGIAYMLGHHLAQKILGGVICGTALVLLAPQLMA